MTCNVLSYCRCDYNKYSIQYILSLAQSKRKRKLESLDTDTQSEGSADDQSEGSADDQSEGSSDNGAELVLRESDSEHSDEMQTDL